MAVRAFMPNCETKVGAARANGLRGSGLENGMDARRKPFHPVTTKSNPKHAVAPNLLQQDFTAQQPNARVDGGYYVHSDHTGMVVLGGSVGCVFPARHRLGHVREARMSCWWKRPCAWPSRVGVQRTDCSTIRIVAVNIPVEPIGRAQN